MYHYLIELAFWILLAFFVGCFLGGLARMRFGVAEAVPDVIPVVAPVAAVAEPPKKRKAVAVKAKPVKRVAKKKTG